MLESAITWTIGLVSGLVQFVVAMWIFNKYILPRMAPGMVKSVVETKEVQDLVKRGKLVLTDVEKYFEKLKGLNLEKIDGETINEALTSIKCLVKNFESSLEKPTEIPEPDA